MKNAKELDAAMSKVFNDIDKDNTLAPKGRELNKAISNMISFAKARINYQQYRNENKKIDIFE